MKYFGIIVLIVAFTACEKEVSVTPPDTVPNRGVISVSSSPANVMIFLNDRNSGKLTPDSLRFLDPGEQKITLKKEFYKDTTLLINLGQDEKREFFVDYYANPSMYGNLYITSEPDSAVLYLNDSLLTERSPLLLTGLIPGRYSIKYELYGHRSVSLNSIVTSSVTTNVQTILRDTTVWVDFQTSNSPIASNYLNCLDVDLQNKIWIGTEDAGLLSFDGGSFTTYSTANSSISSNKISCLLVDELNNVWIGTDAGVNVFNGSSWQLYNRSNSVLNSNNITSIKKNINGDIFISTATGIFSFNGNQWNDYSDRLNPYAYINDIEIDDDSTIWVATSIYGIYEVTPTDTINYTDVNSDIPTKVISSVTKAMDGKKWFTHVSYLSQRGGISSYNDAEFESFFIGSTGISPRSIYIDDVDNKWVSSNEGIFILTSANTEIRINRSNSLISSINIHDIDIDGNGVVWIATYSGLNKYKINNE